MPQDELPEMKDMLYRANTEIQKIKERLDEVEKAIVAIQRFQIHGVQKQIDVLKEHSHKHTAHVDGEIVYPFNPDYEPDQEWKCQHCGKSEGTWFDRCLDENGDMTTRCNACGMDIDEPKSDVDNPVTDEKPSEFISIRRDVAEEFYNLYKGMTGGCLEKLTTAIKQELKG